LEDLLHKTMKMVECTLKNLLSLEELFIDYQADVGDLERPELKLSIGVDDLLLVHEASDAVFAHSHHQLGVLANLCTCCLAQSAQPLPAKPCLRCGRLVNPWPFRHYVGMKGSLWPMTKVLQKR